MLNGIVQLFYPRVCAGCGGMLSENKQQVCRTCLASFDRFPDAASADGAIKEIFRRNQPRSEDICRAWSLYRFHKNDRLQTVIHTMKYGGSYRLGTLFGRLLADMIDDDLPEEPVTCIVPVPLHRLKKIERTYNQSEILAESMGDVLCKNVRTDLVVRKRYTGPQAGLTLQERRGNVDNAFMVVSDRIPEAVLLVDDVMTTGSTAAAVVRSLRSAGVRIIMLATIALAS